jgi:WD40 repeat protein
VSRWHAPVPGERESADRSWEVVRQAYADRLPAPRRPDRRALIAAAMGIAVLAAALSPPGLAVWGFLHDAVSTEDHLVALPSGGRLLVNAQEGAWVVSPDGSKRFLSGYRDAAWSPHGLYVAAARGNQLVALEPNGKVHWKLARRGRVRDPQWSYEGYRIAYFAGGALRVVNGDGTGDRLLTRDARPGLLAWKPGAHTLTYVTRDGVIARRNVDTAQTWLYGHTPFPRRLEWTSNGRLVVTGTHAVWIFGHREPPRRIVTRARIGAASASPDGKRIAIASGGTISIDGRRVFSGEGRINDVVWSPDAHWLLVNWATSDQWLFVRTPATKLLTVSNIRGTFGGGMTVAGWCCP